MTTRTRAAGLLVIGSPVIGFLMVLGCGSNPEAGKGPSNKAEPAAAAIPNGPSSPTPPTTIPAAATVSPTVKLVHELDPSKHEVPAAPIAGQMGGVVFTPEVLVLNDSLVFRVLKPGTETVEREFQIKLGSALDPKAYNGRKLVINQTLTSGADVPELMVVPADGNPHLYSNGYALTLELGHRLNWKLPGKIYLCLPDQEKTVLAGVFEADYSRQLGEPPGPEDKPYIQGEVKVVGAPKTTLRVGYFYDVRPFSVASADLVLGDPANPVGSVRINYDKPRVTTVTAGESNSSSAHFEHSRLTPGRYLVYATLAPSGPTAWKWVTVGPGDSVTANLKIDATKTGAVDIGVPLEAVKDVQMAPADEPGQSQQDPDLLMGCALQLGLIKPINQRKALFTNLGPGRYVVRVSSGLTKEVEIVSGKTVELDFATVPIAPPKPEPKPEQNPAPVPVPELPKKP